jgi:hypothetical protein
MHSLIVTRVTVYRYALRHRDTDPFQHPANFEETVPLPHDFAG